MIHDLFTIPVYKTHYSGPLDQIEHEVRTLLSRTVSDDTNVSLMKNGASSSARVAEDLHINPVFADLGNFIHEHAEKFWLHMGYDRRRLPRLRMMWGNIYPNSGYIEAHDHAPAPLTISFYVRKSDRASNIIFEHPLELLLKHQPIEGLRDRTQYFRMFEAEVPVEQGDLVIFPGWLRHKTRSVVDSEDRIVVGGILDQDFRARVRGHD
jgi:uncharacterized protein (TIGR02466 family)